MSKKSLMISAVVLTRNEEKNIGECLKTLEWCGEIVVVDDFSEDETVERVQKIKIFQRHLDGDFAGQRNFGLEKASGNWALFVDADERVPAALAAEINNLQLTINNLQGFYIRRKDFFFGKWLNHGETGAVRLLRLGKKNAGKWVRKVDEVWRIKGKTATLKNSLLHYPHPSLKEFLESINYFSTLNARVFYERGQRVRFWEWLKPLAKFCQNYFWRLGFLDGTAGFVHAVLMSLHSFLVRGKLFMLWKREGGWKEN